MLKKLSVALCVASVFGVGVAQAGTGSGQVIFDGVVKETPATILVKAGNNQFELDSEATNIIQLGEYTYAELESGTFPNRFTEFDIILKRDGVTTNHFSTVDLTFTAANVNSSGVIMNTTSPDSGGAKNVGVAVHYVGAMTQNSTTVTDTTNAGQLFDATGRTVIQVDDINHGEFDPTFRFKAALQKYDEGRMFTGKVRATMNVEMTYY